MPMRIAVIEISCKRCGHRWYPRMSEVRRCAKCKSPYWDRERENRRDRVQKEG